MIESGIDVDDRLRCDVEDLLAVHPLLGPEAHAGDHRVVIGGTVGAGCAPKFGAALHEMLADQPGFDVVEGKPRGALVGLPDITEQ